MNNKFHGKQEEKTNKASKHLGSNIGQSFNRSGKIPIVNQRSVGNADFDIDMK